MGIMPFKNKKTLNRLHDTYSAKIDDLAADRFLRQFLLHINDCALCDASDLISDRRRRVLPPEALYPALAMSNARRFAREHRAEIDDARILSAIAAVFGTHTQNLPPLLDDFLRNSYNIFMRSLTCVVPLEKLIKNNG